MQKRHNGALIFKVFVMDRNKIKRNKSFCVSKKIIYICVTFLQNVKKHVQ